MTATSPSSLAWMRGLDGWGLFAFAAGTCFLFGQGQQQTLGVVMIAALALSNALRLRVALKRLFPVPPEIWFYSAWVAWAFFTGPVAALSLANLWEGLKVLLQVFLVVWATAAITAHSRNRDVVFYAILAGALIQIWFVIIGAGGMEAVMSSSDRATGTANNSNFLGFLMVWSAFCAMLFWNYDVRLRWLPRGAILAYLPLASYVLLASGSRKSTLAMGLLLYLWAVFVAQAKRGLLNLLLSLAIGGLLLVSFVHFLPNFIEKTTAGRRFQEFVDDGRGDVTVSVQREGRLDMYLEGLNIFGRSPLIGVGLNNFQNHYRTGQNSHSNYIEPLATTGLLGFFLFQTSFILPLLRIRRLLDVIRDQAVRYRLKVYLLGIMAIMVLGVGAPFYTSSPVYLILTAISMSTWRLQRQFRETKRALAHATDPTKVARPSDPASPDLSAMVCLHPVLEESR